MKALAGDRKHSQVTMRDDTPICRAVTYVAFFVGLWNVHLLLRDSTWQGSTELHALMEATAIFLALLVGVIALVRFYSKKTNPYLFIGVGFLGTGLLDGYHAIVTSPWFADLFPSILPSLVPWSWIASRVFLSVCLWLSLVAWRREVRMRARRRVRRSMMYVTGSLLILPSFLVFSFFSLPEVYSPAIVLSRPEELIPAGIFLLAFVGYLRKGHWRYDDFEHWLVLALILAITGQAMFMTFSGQVFDGMFDAAHLLKKASYTFVLIGLLISMYHLFRRAEESTFELGRANEVLQTEIAERERAQRAVEKAHEKAEIWVQERTAQLAQANEVLQREIADRTRAESELEVLHELSRQLDSTLELEDVLELALVKVKELVGVDLAVISIVDQRSGGLVLRAHPQVPPEKIQAMIQSEVGEWITGKAAEGGGPVLVDHLSEQHRLSSLATILGGIESLICVPLKAKGAVIGHITLASAMPGRFTERGISFLSSAASVVATASDNASLYAQTKKDAEAKALLLRELNHRVRNNLATIVGLLSMELGRKRQWTAEEALKACIDRAQRLAAIHDLLAQDEFRELDLKKLVEDVAKAAVRGFSWEENVTITVDAPPLRLPPNLLASLALAANELITNALIHAFPSGDAGHIQVQVMQEGGEILLEVRDNGVGIPATEDGGVRKGVGLEIVTSLVETDLRGQFHLENEKGAVATIRFPRPKRAEG
ncbi:MAG: MASE3 domain-containing protein [candidate division NC10 bacterium]